MSKPPPVRWLGTLMRILVVASGHNSMTQGLHPRPAGSPPYVSKPADDYRPGMYL